MFSCLNLNCLSVPTLWTWRWQDHWERLCWYSSAVRWTQWEQTHKNDETGQESFQGRTTGQTFFHSQILLTVQNHGLISQCIEILKIGKYQLLHNYVLMSHIMNAAYKYNVSLFDYHHAACNPVFNFTWNVSLGCHFQGIWGILWSSEVYQRCWYCSDVLPCGWSFHWQRLVESLPCPSHVLMLPMMTSMFYYLKLLSMY